MCNRTVFPAVALALMLVTAGCAGVLNNTPVPDTDGQEQASPSTNADVQSPGEQSSDQQSSQSVSNPGSTAPSRTIKIAASGQVQTQPNQAVLRVAVEATGQNASIVRQRLAENVSQMRSALADMGIESSQITTVSYDIRNRGRFEPREERPPFWGRHAFAITLTEHLNETGKVIVTAVENGATSVDDVQFTLSEEKRRELRNEALADAMGNAREQATIIAEQANLSVAGVGSVQTADIGFRPVRFEAAALAGGADGGGVPTSIEGGAVTITAQVQVTYNATAET